MIKQKVKYLTLTSGASKSIPTTISIVILLPRYEPYPDHLGDANGGLQMNYI